MKHFFSVLVFFAFLTGPALAAKPALVTYDFDPAHTRVLYRVSHLGFVHLPGHFSDVSGTLVFDPAKVEESAVDVTVRTASVSMDNETLDKVLKGKKFFNTDIFPTITFKSTMVEKTGPETGRVTGNLTLLGVTRPVTLAVTFNRKGWDKYDGVEAVGFSARGQLKRSDFGMTSYLPDVGDPITLEIDAEAHQKPVEEQR